MKTILFLSNYVEAATSSTNVSVNVSGFDAILQASPLVQLTLLALVMLSVLCWAVGYTKFIQFKNIRKSNDLFLLKFWKVNSLDTLFEDLGQYEHSTVASVFKAAYLEMKKIAESPHLSKQDDNASHPQLSGLDNIERAIRKAADNEISKMESKLTVLATTGSTGPFIGLFGTVWGIMSAFQKIGAAGSASLAVVAPGISEALIATAVGLAAAIPAVIMYNNFIAQLRKEEIELNNFGTDFLNIVKRNFFKSE